jgi:arginase family enzyme
MTGITRLCFERIEPYQLSESQYDLLDLSDIRSTYCLCDQKTLGLIGKRLRRRKHKGIALLGSGNYHYVTYLLLSELTCPFSLVLFDHHPDMLPAPSREVISCGSWALEAIEKLPLLKKVIIIGVKKELTAAIPAKYRRKISIFPEGWRWEDEKLLSVIPTSGVYLSIDKDVLSETDAVTDWDQGTMKLSQLLALVRRTAAEKLMYGLDLCGEWPASDLRKKGAARMNAQADHKVIALALSLWRKRRHFGAAS